MNKPKVFISHYMPDAGLNMIRSHCDIDYYNGTEPLAKQEFIARAQQADAVVCFVCDYIDEEIVASCPNVKIFSSFGKGFDNIDVEACTKRNILVTINPDALTDSTADLAIGLLLAMSRNILSGDWHVREKQFKGWHATNWLGRDFHHSRLGIVGFGAIGQAIARRANGFDVEIEYYDLKRNETYESNWNIKFKRLPELMQESDFVIVAVDLRPENVRLIDREQIRLMKQDAFLINISRGSIVDEEAVAEALRDGAIHGYAADVFSFEDRVVPNRSDYIHDDLLRMKAKTVLTPHIGTGTIEARNRLAISCATQLLDALRGKVPEGGVNGIRTTALI